MNSSFISKIRKVKSYSLFQDVTDSAVWKKKIFRFSVLVKGVTVLHTMIFVPFVMITMRVCPPLLSPAETPVHSSPICRHKYSHNLSHFRMNFEGKWELKGAEVGKYFQE